MVSTNVGMSNFKILGKVLGIPAEVACDILQLHKVDTRIVS